MAFWAVIFFEAPFAIVAVGMGWDEKEKMRKERRSSGLESGVWPERPPAVEPFPWVEALHFGSSDRSSFYQAAFPSSYLSSSLF